MQNSRFFCLTLVIFTVSHCASGAEVVTLKDAESASPITGEIMVEAADGGVLLRADDGRIWTLQPEQIAERKSDDIDFAPVDGDEMVKRLEEEFDESFSLFRTSNYIIVFNGDERYAARVGALFEQLHRSFYTYWKNQRWELPEPAFPLVAVVLRDHDAFLEHAGAEIGETAKTVIGYYNLASNRMTTFNVPNWERNVATIIHEATHQLAYNCGMQKRYADNPMWVSEGLATYFESPDLRKPGQWRSIGRVNHVNLKRWKNYFPRRPEESLATLLADDRRYRSSATATDAYAEGWAFTYFLIKTRREQYVDYLRKLSEGKPLAEQSPRARIDLFEKTFGTTLIEIDKAFVTYMRRVRG